MKILLVADGRSPTTRSWVRMLQPLGFELHLVSTFDCPPVEGTVSTRVLPVAFSRYAGSQAGGSLPKTRFGLISRTRGLAGGMRHLLGPLTVNLRARQFAELVKKNQPDLVHALRIPYEGMLASFTPPGTPLVISTWGNDFTLHAPSTPWMSSFTRRSLHRADGLLSDTFRDIRISREWGLDPSKPTLAVPGGGGIDLDKMRQAVMGIERVTPPRVVNPRGIRSYTRTDTFFRSIPAVLTRQPEAHFVCVSMAGQPHAESWVERLDIASSVTLLPMVSQMELWQEFSRSTVSVSVSTHDGTPNSLLEAMSLGCLPVCGDLESIREWIVPGGNGLLVDPADPADLAQAICRGIEDQAFNQVSANRNLAIIRERAQVSSVRQQVVDFYTSVSHVK